jgi:hypothetical protein
MNEELNNPEFFLPDVMQEVAAWAAIELNIPINFDHGYIEEINLRLTKKNSTAAGKLKKFPLVWLVSPFSTRKGESFDIFAKHKVRILIITNSQKDSNTRDRFDKQYKLLLSKIALKVIGGLNENKAIKSEITRPYNETYNGFWGERQKSVFDDVVDVLELEELEISILNNQNC